MKASWPEVIAWFGALFVGFNLVFAALYVVQPGCVANRNPDNFLGNFFFSVETFATVGYGDMHPLGLYAHSLATIEMFSGLFAVALMTGALFARFSRPQARVMFSRVGVVRPWHGHATLMLRTANARQNVILEATAQLRMVRDDVSPEGYRMRRIIDLPLVRATTPIFQLGWLIMHVVDETSPLWGASATDLTDHRAILVLTLQGTDETTGQPVTARYDYAADAIRWNHAFRDVLTGEHDGADLMDYREFHQTEALGDTSPVRP